MFEYSVAFLVGLAQCQPGLGDGVLQLLQAALQMLNPLGVLLGQRLRCPAAGGDVFQLALRPFTALQQLSHRLFQTDHLFASRVAIALGFGQALGYLEVVLLRHQQVLLGS